MKRIIFFGKVMKGMEMQIQIQMMFKTMMTW
jgi:hypothetical protein